MAEGNGTGKLDRIEALLLSAAEKIDKVATMGYLHDERLSRVEASLEDLIAAQKQQGETLIAAQKQQGESLDKRVGELVSAIRGLIDRIPPENLR